MTIYISVYFVISQNYSPFYDIIKWICDITKYFGISQSSFCDITNLNKWYKKTKKTNPPIKKKQLQEKKNNEKNNNKQTKKKHTKKNNKKKNTHTHTHTHTHTQQNKTKKKQQQKTKTNNNKNNNNKKKQNKTTTTTTKQKKAVKQNGAPHGSNPGNVPFVLSATPSKPFK